MQLELHNVQYWMAVRDIKKNTFNIKTPNSEQCGSKGTTIYHGDSSYITYVTWDDFAEDPQKFINKACGIQAYEDDYDIAVQL